jgi:flagellar hook-associated protein 3 FlgL
MAETVSRLQQTMTVLEASQASFARLSQLSLFQFLR